MTFDHRWKNPQTKDLGLWATDIVRELRKGFGAGKIAFDDTTAGLSVTTVQAAIEALAALEYALLNVENQTLTGGVTVTSKNLGTIDSGTLTLDMGDRPQQHYTNDGAHTLAPGTVFGSCYLDIINGDSAGAITTDDWDVVDGDDFTTTEGDKFTCVCKVGEAGSLLQVKAMQ